MLFPPETFKNARVFLTGGTGFVGSDLAERLVQLGCANVRCLVRTDLKWLAGVPIQSVRGTLDDTQVLKNALQDVTHIIHVGALTRSQHWADFESANVQGTEKLLTLAADVPGLQQIVLTSSLAAIGRHSDPVADENTPFNPVSMYGKSKAHMEELAATVDLPITIVRPPAVYGPRETDIFTFFKTLSKGLCPVVGSADKTALSLVHVDDLVEGMIQATFNRQAIGHTFFLGGVRDYAWGEIRDPAALALGRKVLTIPISTRFVQPLGAVLETLGGVFGAYPPLNREKAREIVEATIRCDSSKAMSMLDYNPSKDLKTGISETIRWYREHQWL